MNNKTTSQTSIQPQSQRLLKIVGTLLIAVGIAIAIFFGRSHRAPSLALPSVEVSALTQDARADYGAGTLVAYNVDYEMDKARAEKTIEHYEGMEPIVDQAIKNNEENPDSKATAENSYQRETKLNDALPESIGEEFSQAELSDMER